jgi:hypothetical protein
MISDISNAESGSDVDDFGSFFQKGVDYGYLTPVHEEVSPKIVLFHFKPKGFLVLFSFLLEPMLSLEQIDICSFS